MRAGRCRALAALAAFGVFWPGVTSEQLEEGVPLFLDHLEVVLGVGEVSPGDDPARRNAGAAAHGAALQRAGFTIAHAVHGYGDVCQVVTELAEDLGHPITVSEFHAFNWCVTWRRPRP